MIQGGDTEYRSDTVQAQVSDPTESAHVFSRDIYYDVPQQEMFSSHVSAGRYAQNDGQILFNAEEHKVPS